MKTSPCKVVIDASVSGRVGKSVIRLVDPAHRDKNLAVDKCDITSAADREKSAKRLADKTGIDANRLGKKVDEAANATLDKLQAAQEQDAERQRERQAESEFDGSFVDLTKPEGRTDVANGRRFVAKFGDRVRWCRDWGGWLVWDGKRWKPDETARAERLAKKVAGAMWKEFAKIAPKLARSDTAAVVGFCKYTNSVKGIQGMLTMARSEPGVAITPSELDTRKWLLNCENGTLDLETGKLHPHRKRDMITQLCPVAYDPLAVCRLWKKCLKRWMDGKAEKIEYLRRVAGYGLTADVSEQALFFLYGLGSNGKSTFLNTLREMLGDYAIQAVADLLMAKKHEGHPTDKADLFGKRFVATIEVDDGKRIAESLMKQLTGGENVRAHKMRRDNFEFKQTWKIFLAANHKPQIKGTDLGSWRRIKMIPFTVTITKKEKKRHKNLDEELKAEWPGILAWAVRGCQKWRSDGLSEPGEVTAATADYRKECDTLEQFLEEECDRSRRHGKIQVSRLLEMYRVWSGNKNYTQPELTARMRDKGFESIPGAGNRKFYHGVAVKPDETTSCGKRV